MELELRAPITVQAVGPDGAPRRRIDGVAVPWNVTANASTGPVRFLPGALPADGPAPKLVRDHDLGQPIGLVTERLSTPDGMLFSAKISATTPGDEALTLAVDGVLDAVSVGVRATDWSIEADGTMVVAAGDWLELSLVPFGAFPQARVQKVAATPDPEPTPVEEPMTELSAPVEAAPAVVPSPTLSFTPAPRRKVTAGEYAIAAVRGDLDKPHIAAVLQQEEAADIPGLIPELLIGDVFDLLTDTRPLVSALGTLGMPGGGDTFKRRKVVQHTLVGLQANEYDVLSSQKFLVDPVTVTKQWIGGTLELSEQAIAYSDVSLVDRVIIDMARGYAAATEAITGIELAGGAATAGTTVTDWTDGDEIVACLFEAAAEMWANAGVMPEMLVVDSATWSKIATAKDSGGNRIFPFLGPSNASGTMGGATTLAGNPLGLQLVVNNSIVVAPATEAAILLNRRGIELYEEQRGALRVESPSTLSTTLAWRGIFAVADLDLGNIALNIA